MAGIGYLVMGMLSILPTLVVAAYVVQHPRFRKGMPTREWVLCWACVLSAFFFPLTCGMVGANKRRRTIIDMEHLETFDWGFFVVQFHMMIAVFCFALFQQLGSSGANATKAPGSARRGASILREPGSARRLTPRGPGE
mmetsp:Transcript_74397/g.168538  ORF Transcript_74397/g.168538 Transcript_74397/m.168538 type:complete len:139 (-) Transcript_74397:76-492(-)